MTIPLQLEKGKYLFVITNDIRYIETTYSIGLNVSVLDWRFVKENIKNKSTLVNMLASKYS